MISIVVPSYGHARFLGKTIESVQAQTYEDWELLVLDDQSPDASYEIASSFHDPRVKPSRNVSNLGTYATLNRGLDIAQGDWIAILNSDDLWKPRKLEWQMRALEENPDCVWSYTFGELIGEDSKPLVEQGHHKDYPLDGAQDVLPFLLHVNQVLASSVVFRKGAVRFQEGYRACGDWVAAINLARLSKAAFVPDPVVGWRQHGENTSGALKKVIREDVKVRETILSLEADWKENRPDEPWQSKRDWCALELAAHYVALGDMDAARKLLAHGPTGIDAVARKVWSRRKLFTMFPQWIAKIRLAPGTSPGEFRGLPEAATPQIS